MGRYGQESSQGFKPNHAVVPALVNPPVIFIAPSSLTGGSGELWAAVSCNDANYGGCFVWASNDGLHYERIGLMNGSSIQGFLTTDLPSGDLTDSLHPIDVTLHSIAGTIESVNQKTVDTFDSACYVGSEFLAYRDAMLTGANSYTLSYLKRGLYGSSQGAFTNDSFVILNDSLFRYRFNKNLVGNSIYFKFQGFNTTKGGLQSLDEIVEYGFSITHDGGVIVLHEDLQPIKDDVSLLQSSKNSPIRVAINAKSVGDINTHVASILNVEAKEYTQVIVEFGCENVGNTATFEIRDYLDNLLWEISYTGMLVEVSGSGFTLLESKTLHLYLRSNNALDNATIKGFYLK